MGELNNIDARIRLASSSSVFRLQNSSSTDKLTLNNSGDLSVAGTFTCASLVSDTIVYISGNSNFKHQGGSYTKRYEQQSGGDIICGMREITRYIIFQQIGRCGGREISM